jgi:hypothetical protein
MEKYALWCHSILCTLCKGKVSVLSNHFNTLSLINVICIGMHVSVYNTYIIYAPLLLDNKFGACVCLLQL